MAAPDAAPTAAPVAASISTCSKAPAPAPATEVAPAPAPAAAPTGATCKSSSSFPIPILTTILFQAITSNTYILNLANISDYDLNRLSIGNYVIIGDPTSITSEIRQIFAFDDGSDIILDKLIKNNYPQGTPINIYATNPVNITSQTTSTDATIIGLEKILASVVPILQKSFQASSNNFGNNPNADWNNYLLKTKIVPPICPACPACPNFSGNCLSCGNSTGSNYSPSTSTTTSTSTSKTTSSPSSTSSTSSTSNSTNNNNRSIHDGQNSVGGVINNTVNTVGDLGKTALVGAGMLGETALVGTGALAYSAGKGVTDLLHGNRYNNGYYNNYNYNQQNGGYRQNGGYGQNTQMAIGQGAGIGGYGTNQSGPMNPYTYNGALSQKPSSNFIPLTSDFSKFGR